MSNAIPSGIGQSQGTGDRKALFLKVWSGEVLTTFQNATHMLDKHVVRTISSGRSAQFPVTGVAEAKYHAPGQNIFTESLTSTVNHAEKIIGIDGLCLSSVFISNIEEAMNHYDVRSIYSTECGRSLANHFDKCVTNTVIAAARTASPNITGLTGSGGLSLRGGVATTGAATAPTAAEVITFARTAAAAFDRKDVPSAERYLMVRPDMYYSLVNAGLTTGNNLINRDFNDNNGSMAKGVVYEVMGMKILKSNHLPSTNINTGLLTSNQIASENDVFSGGVAGYGADFSTTVAVAFQKGAVGTVKLLDLATESEYQIERQGTLMVCKYAMGHGVLRPECAIELVVGTGASAGV